MTREMFLSKIVEYIHNVHQRGTVVHINVCAPVTLLWDYPYFFSFSLSDRLVADDLIYADASYSITPEELETMRPAITRWQRRYGRIV